MDCVSGFWEKGCGKEFEYEERDGRRGEQDVSMEGTTVPYLPGDMAKKVPLFHTETCKHLSDTHW